MRALRLRYACLDVRRITAWLFESMIMGPVDQVKRQEPIMQKQSQTTDSHNSTATPTRLYSFPRPLFSDQ